MKNGSARWLVIGVAAALVAGVVASVIAAARRQSPFDDLESGDFEAIAPATEETPQPVS